VAGLLRSQRWPRKDDVVIDGLQFVKWIGPRNLTDDNHRLAGKSAGDARWRVAVLLFLTSLADVGHRHGCGSRKFVRRKPKRPTYTPSARRIEVRVMAAIRGCIACSRRSRLCNCSAGSTVNCRTSPWAPCRWDARRRSSLLAKIENHQSPGRTRKRPPRRVATTARSVP